MVAITEFARVAENFVSYHNTALIRFVTRVLERTAGEARWEPYKKEYQLVAEKLATYIAEEKHLRAEEKTGNQAEITYLKTVVSNARNALLWSFLHYAHIVQVVADGDKEIIESTGLMTKKTGERNMVVKLDNIATASILYENPPSKGILILFSVVTNAKWYEIEVAYDPDYKIFEPFATVTNHRTTHTNFIGGTKAVFRVRAGGARGLVSNWYYLPEMILPLNGSDTMQRR